MLKPMEIVFQPASVCLVSEYSPFRNTLVPCLSLVSHMTLQHMSVVHEILTLTSTNIQIIYS